MQTDYDVVVIGAGLIGLATARDLVARRPGLRIAVLEREASVAAHQSGHNSGVIHAGVYYVPGSHKALLCVAGARSMRRYCGDRGIPIRECGKVIVATRPDELERLDGILARGRANGVPAIERLGPDRLREIEPHAAGIAAVWSPTTAIVDFSAVAHAFARDIEAAGGEILLDRDVIGLVGERSGVTVRTRRGEVRARWLIGCAGAWADRLAVLDGGEAMPAIVPFRGSYWRLRSERRSLVRGLIYPVPDPALPFLGVHFTPRIDGDVWLGPNAFLAAARDGYRRRDVRIRDLAETLSTAAFWRFARQHWRTGVDELVGDLSRRRLLGLLRRYIPELALDDIVAGPSGVRAQALTAHGALLDDFAFDHTAHGIHVRNAPSPAATSALEIGREVADRAAARFGLT